MKNLIFLFCAAAAVYFIWFSKPGKTPQTEKGKMQKTVSVSQAVPQSMEYRYKENSLGRQLAALAKDKSFTFGSGKNGTEIDVRNAGVRELRAAFKNNPQILKKTRELVNFKELGIVSGPEDPRMAISHLKPFQTAITVLTASALLRIRSGKNAEAARDFEYAAQLLKTVIKGSGGCIELAVCSRSGGQLKQIIKTSPLLSKAKQEALQQLPVRKDYAEVLHRILETDKKQIFFLLDDKENRLDMKKIFDLSDEQEKLIRKMSRTHLDKLIWQGQQQIVHDFTSGTLSPQSVLNVGTEQENGAIQLLLAVKLYGRISENLKN